MGAKSHHKSIWIHELKPIHWHWNTTWMTRITAKPRNSLLHYYHDDRVINKQLTWKLAFSQATSVPRLDKLLDTSCVSVSVLVENGQQAIFGFRLGNLRFVFAGKCLEKDLQMLLCVVQRELLSSPEKASPVRTVELKVIVCKKCISPP